MLNSIRLLNFKCFRKLKINLGQLHILSGLNGMGKSTVIQSLLLTRQSSKTGESQVQLDGELFQFGSGSDLLYEFADSDDLEVELRFSEGDVRWPLRLDRISGTVQPQAALLRLGHESLFGDSFRYLAAERQGPRATYPLSDVAVKVQRNLGIYGEFTAHFLETYSDLQVAPRMHHPHAASPTLIEQTRAWLGEISPGTQVQTRVHNDLGLAAIQYTFPGQDRVRTRGYRPTQVGFGLSYALPVIVALLSSQPDSLTLIENPEAHLHPRGQSRLGELLARCAGTGAQCLVETHSDHLLNGVRVAVRKQVLPDTQVGITYFQEASTPDQGLRRAVPISIDPNGRLSHWPEGFFDEWDRNLEELLS